MGLDRTDACFFHVFFMRNANPAETKKKQESNHEKTRKVAEERGKWLDWEKEMKWFSNLSKFNAGCLMFYEDKKKSIVKQRASFIGWWIEIFLREKVIILIMKLILDLIKKNLISHLSERCSHTYMIKRKIYYLWKLSWEGFFTVCLSVLIIACNIYLM